MRTLPCFKARKRHQLMRAWHVDPEQPALLGLRIPKLLGESLRQFLQQSGLPDTARAPDQSCSEMNSVQNQRGELKIKT